LNLASAFFSFLQPLMNDLICGNHIIDRKVKTNPRKKLREDVAQMVSLCVCARLNGIETDKFSLYFARHGYA